MALRIDPHTHSAVSDGTDSLPELLEKASATGLDVVGVVDHDTFGHWQELQRLAPAFRDLGILPGIELSCETQTGVGVHLLGYLIKRTDGQVSRIIARAQRERVQRLRKMTAMMSVDFPITYDEVLRYVSPGGTPGRPHLADALVEKGYFPNRSDAFDKVLNRRSRYYVHRWAPTPVEAIRAVVEDGGVAIVAHPFAARKGKKLSPASLSEMRDAGLFGLEVYHRDHTPADRETALAAADQYGLAISGASDYHGSGKPNLLGENLMPEETLLKLIKQASGKMLNSHVIS